MIRYGLPFSEYTSIPAAHFSTLKALDTSPLHYQRAITFDREDTPALRMGRATHSLILTPEAVDVAVWDGGRRAGKAWDAFCAEHAGRTLLTRKEAETAERMRANVLAHPAARHLLSAGNPEVSIEWSTADGLRCKARADWLRPGGVGIVELKTTRHIGPRSFPREFASRLYHAQAAFYLDGLIAALADAGECPRVAPPVTMIAVENVPPHDVTVWRIPDEVLEVGRRKVDAWLVTLGECMRSGTWPGVGGVEAMDMKLPEWAETDGLPDVDEGGIQEEDHGGE